MDTRDASFENEYTRIPQLVRELGSADDAARKMAAFRLQSAIGDPSYADIFAQEGGLPKLQYLVLRATGNTLAYALASFTNLLGLDQGWDYVTPELLDRLVQLICSHPLVNILRGAMSILVAVVSHPAEPSSETFGYDAIKPCIERQPNFIEMLVSRLSSADHALCANALQLVNALMRDSITQGSNAEWPKFVKRLQDLGVIRSVYALMQGTGLQDLAHALLEFQSLTKALLRKWRDWNVDLSNPEHRRSLKAIRAAGTLQDANRDTVDDSTKPRDPEKWRRLGFDTESPARDFEEVGFLGLMDLMDYVRKDEDAFRRLLLEQSTKAPEKRCPTAKTSLAVTSMLCAHFEIDDDEEDQQLATALDRSQLDRFFKPLILQWSRLHTAGIKAFQRLWATTGAEAEDFHKIQELVSTLMAQVISLASRTKDISVAEHDIATFDLAALRELQMNLLEMTHEEQWGRHLRQIQDDLRSEAMQFMREQRIRCLLQGTWFANLQDPTTDGRSMSEAERLPWRFIRLSPNRKYIHYGDFERRLSDEEAIPATVLYSKIDLAQISSVVSNVSSSNDSSRSNSTVTLRSPSQSMQHRPSNVGDQHDHVTTRHKITILGYANKSAQEAATKHKRNESVLSSSTAGENEVVLLSLFPSTRASAAEWLDGLLMLLQQTPITPETEKLVKFIADCGLKIRLLNVRFEEALGGIQGAGAYNKKVELPSRDGVDDEFYYDIAGA